MPTTASTAIIEPTITLTPAPQSLADAPDLSTWVEDYVHAYESKVTVNGVEMDAEQLTAAIRQNPDEFTQIRSVNGENYSFLLINNIPLAMISGNGQWQEATIAKLAEFEGIGFECSLRLDDRKYIEFLDISKKVFNKNSVVVLTTNLDVTKVFGNFTQKDWQKVINNWDSIQSDFAEGKVPSDFPYDWSWGEQAIGEDVKQAFGGDPQYRSQQLYESGLREDGNLIVPLKQFQAHASREDMLKVFEFVVRSRVLQFPQIRRWDVSDEVSAGYVQYLFNNNQESNFWGLATGLSPAQLTETAAQWVKKDNPQAKTYIIESNIFDTANKVAKDELNYFYNTYLPEIETLNTDHAIDGVIGENNWWIYEPQDWSVISERIDNLTAKGLEIGGSETMIVSGDTPINDCCGRHKLVQIQDPELAQAEMYGQWLDLYLNKGIKTIGFGNIDDFYAWTQDVGLPDANPTLFDIDFRTKPAYYAIVQVLYKHLP